MRLVREVCDRWDDPVLWRRHLLTELCTLLQGNVGSIVFKAKVALAVFNGDAALVYLVSERVAMEVVRADAGMRAGGIGVPR